MPPSQGLLRILATDQGNESEHQRKHQQDVNESAHRVAGDQTENPQQQQYLSGDSEHGILSKRRRAIDYFDLYRSPRYCETLWQV